MKKKIRATKHTLKFSNQNKINKLENLLTESRKIAQIYLDYLWSNKVRYTIKDEIKFFDIHNGFYDIPNMLDKKVNDILKINDKTWLSSRILKCILTQVLGIIQASTRKQKKRIYILNKKKKEDIPKCRLKGLITSIKRNNPHKPRLPQNFNLEINSLCLDIKDVSGEFDNFIKLKCLGKREIKFGEIKIPIKLTKPDNKWDERGKLLNSFLICKDNIQFRYEFEKENKKNGKSIGGDQGFKDVLTLSNGNTTPKLDNHGHSLESILLKLSRKKKGSKGFIRTQEHRKNFINWSINNINLYDIREIRLEKIFNIRYKKRSSRLMSGWTNTLIRDKIKSKADETGVLITEQSSTYRSQRCSNCGNVRKSNRKGKIYTCKNCGFESDSDLNAAINHELVLPDVPYELRKLRKNLGNGFFWKETGFYDFEGQAFTVPDITARKES